jgi:integrase
MKSVIRECALLLMVVAVWTEPVLARSYLNCLTKKLVIVDAVSPSSDYVVASERGGPMTPLSIVVWFNRAFKNIGLKGCSSHSGRRTFVTRAARIVHKAGGSLRDVQLLAGHRSIQTTQRYIDGDSDAQRKLVAMI